MREVWRYAGAKATGGAHLKSGVACQDSFALGQRNEVFVAALADGAGSAPKADRGATTAVDVVVRSAMKALALGQGDLAAVLNQAALAARSAIADMADGEGAPLADFASTLLAVVAGPDGGAVLQVGDGVIVVGDDGTDWAWVFWPQHGEYANTTHFLTDEDAETTLQVDRLPPNVTDIALMSDGLERLSLHHATKTVHQPFFAGLFQPLLRASGVGPLKDLSAALESFLDSTAVKSRTDDDVSLVIATRRNEGSTQS